MCEEQTKSIKNSSLSENAEIVVSKENIDFWKENVNKYAKSNLVDQEYLVANINTVLCSDITQLSTRYHFVFVMDLASKLILGHLVKDKTITSSDIIDLCKEALQNRNITEYSIFHSDRGCQYTPEEFRNFGLSYGLKLSLTDRASHQNQVAEWFIKTLKAMMRPTLRVKYNTKDSTKTLLNRLSFDQIKVLVHKAIEQYNSKPHAGDNMFKASPFNIDEALLNKEPLKIVKSRNDNSKDAMQIREFRADAVEQFANSWKEWFQDWRKESQNNVPETYEQLKLLSGQIYFLVSEIKLLKQEREEKEQRRQKRLNAKKKAIRETVYYEEFMNILALAKGDTYKQARVRIAFIILYFTGLRVSNLLLLKVHHINSLLDTKEMIIQIIKKGPSRNFISIGLEGNKMLEKHFQDIEILKEGKTQEDFLFTINPKRNKGQYPQIALSRENFNRELNHVLREASVLTGKNLRCHSFRATFITDTINSNVGIEKVAEIVGHRDIQFTKNYIRTTVLPAEIRSISTSLSKFRIKGFTKKPPQTRNRRKGGNKIDI